MYVRLSFSPPAAGSGCSKVFSGWGLTCLASHSVSRWLKTPKRSGGSDGIFQPSP